MDSWDESKGFRKHVVPAHVTVAKDSNNKLTLAQSEISVTFSSPVIREAVDWILPPFDKLPQCRVGGASAPLLTLLALIFAYSIFSARFITPYWPVAALALITFQLWRTTASCSLMQKTKKKRRGKLSAESQLSSIILRERNSVLKQKNKNKVVIAGWMGADRALSISFIKITAVAGAKTSEGGCG